MPLAFLSLNLAHVMTFYCSSVFRSPHVRLSFPHVLPHFVHSGAKCYAFWSLDPRGGCPQLIHEGLCVLVEIWHTRQQCALVWAEFKLCSARCLLSWLLSSLQLLDQLNGWPMAVVKTIGIWLHMQVSGCGGTCSRACMWGKHSGQNNNFASVSHAAFASLQL